MADNDTKLDPGLEKQPSRDANFPEDVLVIEGEVINASGHRDQLHRQYGLLAICGMALTVDNAWVAVGTSLSIAICESRLSTARPAEH